jgi:hypothetical protein
MLGADAWAEPSIDWLDTLDVPAVHAHLSADARLLARWPATEFDPTPTDCFLEGDQIWIWQPEVGAVRFSLTAPHITAWLWPGADPAWFRQVVTRSWLPAVYPLWGRQVLHASAAMCTATGDTVAFTGPTHAGKSTTAYGFARRRGWQLLADDTVAFSTASSAPDPAVPTCQTTIRLHPIPQETRLRPATADFYGVGNRSDATVSWPGGAPVLRAIYVLEGDETFASPADFTVLRAAESMPLLLQQAYALSFGIPKYNQALMKDYLAVAAAVPAFRLRYRRSFDVADELFAAIERHVADVVGIDCSPMS